MNRTPLLSSVTAAASLTVIALVGCEKQPNEQTTQTPDTTSHTDHDGHDHDANAPHDGHDAHTDDNHSEETTTQTLEVGGATLEVTVAQDIAPNSEIHVEITLVSGEQPAALRLWVGDQAATGTAKTKADAHDNHFHAHAPTPESLQDASLWIEVETADGTRAAESIALN